MNEDVNGYPYLCVLPAEILLYIFTYLPAKDLVRCRQLCLRLKQIVDELTRGDALWRGHCKIDYPNIYKIARYKSKPGLLWCNIYRSLTLWPKLASAREDLDEFAYASNVSEEVTDFKILRDGVIAIHKQSAIVFYDIETLKPTERGPITGNYLQYTENDDTIVILGHHLHLFIIRKIIKNHRLETNVTFDNVKIFILVDREVYYVTLNNEICVCNLENFINRVINRSDDGVMSIGFSHGKLHVLTFHRNIYTVNGTDLTFTCELGPDSNLLHLLYHYNFLETLDWRTYHQWMFVFNHRVSDGPLQNIIHVRVYGEVVFVGCNFGVLRIYNSPFTAGELDIYNAQPTKQYNFMERNDCPVLSLCPVFKVDVSESEDGHTVFIGMPKKLAVLNFTHNFNRSASVAMLPYKEV